MTTEADDPTAATTASTLRPAPQSLSSSATVSAMLWGLLGMELIAVCFLLVSLAAVLCCAKTSQRLWTYPLKERLHLPTLRPPAFLQRKRSRACTWPRPPRTEDYVDAETMPVKLPAPRRQSSRRQVDSAGYTMVDLTPDSPPCLEEAGGPAMSAPPADSQYNVLGQNSYPQSVSGPQAPCKAYDHVKIPVSRSASKGSLIRTDRTANATSPPGAYDVAVISPTEGARVRVIGERYHCLKSSIKGRADSTGQESSKSDVTTVVIGEDGCSQFDDVVETLPK